ncbi:MAG: DUF2520 domain-containing protein [Acidobacteriia bacterium]|nr:DUF2520 domain-containing protein [Terriglobia bacterium]
MPCTISIIGAGRVGRTLGRRLHQLGWRMGAVVTQSAATSRKAVRAIGAGTALVLPIVPRPSNGARKGTALAVPKRSATLRALAPEAIVFSGTLAADVTLLAVPDGALASVAGALAEIGGNGWRGKIVLHTSGALDRSVLAPLARRGAATGSLHPMQTFSGRATPQLKGVIFAVEGDRKAQRAAQSIARALGGVPVPIAGSSKPAYHAAGVLVAGHALALVEAAVQTLLRIGFSRRRALQTLLPLIRQMLDNFERIGPRASWTGPVARGDLSTVARHVRALRRYPPEFQRAYAALALLGGRVLSKTPAVTLARIARALKNPRGGSV